MLYDILVERIFGYGPSQTAHRRSDQFNPARLVGAGIVIIEVLVAIVPNARLSEGSEFPLEAVDSRKRKGAQAAAPIRPRVAHVNGHPLGIILDPQVAGDPAHHGMADVVI